jgi:hypothetical protein
MLIRSHDLISIFVIQFQVIILNKISSGKITIHSLHKKCTYILINKFSGDFFVIIVKNHENRRILRFLQKSGLTDYELVCSFLYICVFVLGVFHAKKRAPDVVFWGEKLKKTKDF